MEWQAVLLTLYGCKLQEKIDSLTLEYTYLLTSQLESQRRYFTEQMGQRDLEAKYGQPFPF